MAVEIAELDALYAIVGRCVDTEVLAFSGFDGNPRVWRTSQRGIRSPKVKGSDVLLHPNTLNTTGRVGGCNLHFNFLLPKDNRCTNGRGLIPTTFKLEFDSIFFFYKFYPLICMISKRQWKPFGLMDFFAKSHVMQHLQRSPFRGCS